MLEIFDRVQGVFLLFFGIYCVLLAYGVLPRNPKNPEKAALWQRRYGPVMKILSVVTVVFGILLLLGVFS